MRILLSSIILLACISLNAQELNKRSVYGQKEGLWKIYGADIPDSLYAYCDTCTMEEGYYKGGKKIGEWKSFYPGHKIKSRVTYKNGKVSGPYKFYCETGCLRETGFRIATALYDTMKRYSCHADSCGVIVYRSCYKGNKKVWDDHKIIPVVQPDNNKRITGNEVMSDQEIKDGYNRVYDSKRRVLMDGTFKDGKLWGGKWYRYNSKGELTNIELWEEGKYKKDLDLNE